MNPNAVGGSQTRWGNMAQLGIRSDILLIRWGPASTLESRRVKGGEKGSQCTG